MDGRQLCFYEGDLFIKERSLLFCLGFPEFFYIVFQRAHDFIDVGLGACLSLSGFGDQLFYLDVKLRIFSSFASRVMRSFLELLDLVPRTSIFRVTMA